MDLARIAHLSERHVARCFTAEVGDPQPPFDVGSPAEAPAHITGWFREHSRFGLG